MKNTGKFKKGQVKTTPMQFKKHASQMSKSDIDTLTKRVQSIPDLFLSNHVVRKVKDDNLCFQPIAIVEALKQVNGESIIEYNVVPSPTGQMDHRVLVRTQREFVTTVDGQDVACNLCFVLSLDTGRIVTVYWNEAKDAHSNVDMARYTRGLKVV